MNKETIIKTIRKESKNIPVDKYYIPLDSFDLQSFSDKCLREMPVKSLLSLLANIKRLIYEFTIQPCPWCNSKAEIYSNGSYVEGWTAFIECSSWIKCGVKGPISKKVGLSNEEDENRDEAIKNWNTVAGK